MSLTQDRLRELFAYDATTGVFTRRVTTNYNAKAGDVAGCPNKDGYLVIRVDGVLQFAHRLAWLYVHGRWPVGDLDHRDEVKSHNAISNLREVSRSRNMRNRSRPNSGSSTGELGVSPGPKGFRAHITVDGRFKHLGDFADLEDARAARRGSEFHEGAKQ